MMSELSSETAATDTTAQSEVPADQGTVPRSGVPIWRVGKPDTFLAADVATAREAVLSIAEAQDIGRHLGARSEGVRCVTHVFESHKPGYRGWVWFATLTRISRGKASTVNEVGLLPTDDSVLAPPWVPWSERVRPEDQEAAEAQALSSSATGEEATAESPGDVVEPEDAESSEPN